MTEYNPLQIEEKWRKRWEKEGAWKVDVKRAKKPYYNLMMFPYPSAEGLHVGNVYAFTGSDIHGRYMRMRGYDVFEPMGFDAFGIHSENFAIKQGTHPKDKTEKNVEHFRTQLKNLGAIFDWDHEVNTSNPDYYKWTQWLFLQMYKAGLAYRAKAPVDWCPSCKTVLADEQVIKGKCERCDSIVIQKELEQWFLKITKYADRLLNNLDKLDWSEVVKIAQRQWIGKSVGAEIEFSIAQRDVQRFVLLHGRGGSSKKNFLPWLKTNLEKQGYEVFAPDLPNPAEPYDLEQADFIKSNFKLDEQTVIVGHSFGGVVALRLLEQGIRVNRVILVATPLSGQYLDEKDRPTVTSALKRGFDFEKIRKNAKEFIVLSDLGDDVVPLSDGKALSKNLQTYLRKEKGSESHFCASKEQAILEACLPTIKVFTTRLDTLFGATYLVLSPEHERVTNYELRVTNRAEVQSYIEQTKRKTELERADLSREKTGVELKGIKVINPANNEEISVWVADYVLKSYGTGAIMAVPAHDQRDFEFATRYNLPIKIVICPNYPEPTCPVLDKAYEGEGHLVASGKFNGMPSREAREKTTEFVGGEKKVNYHLRDWLISRQRYWGPPIPIVYCNKCGIVPVPEEDLPVELPCVEDFHPTGTNKSPLATIKEFVNTKCPKCGGKARRETDVSDTFLDSSWYFLRYPSVGLKIKNLKLKIPWDSEVTHRWLPVDMYIGGKEHAVLHLMYARFVTMALHDMPARRSLGEGGGLVDFDEPFTKFRAHGLLIRDGAKMSKSRGNVINPDGYFESYGADALRMYLMFLGPYEQGGDWQDRGIVGIARFLKKVWGIYASGKRQDTRGSERNADLDRITHKTIKKVTEDIENLQYNTAIAALMEFTNEIAKQKSLAPCPLSLVSLLKLLAPFAPHITEELWHEALGHKNSIHNEKWPEYDPKKIREEKVRMVIQVNGKVRSQIEVDVDAGEDYIKKLVLKDEKVQKWLDGELPKKIIVVPKRVISIVI